MMADLPNPGAGWPRFVLPPDTPPMEARSAEDRNPLHNLLVPEAPGFPGCVVCARLLGAIDTGQTKEGKKWIRNDRLIALAAIPKRTSASSRSPTAKPELRGRMPKGT
jgi:hypothetical protein